MSEDFSRKWSWLSPDQPTALQQNPSGPVPDSLVPSLRVMGIPDGIGSRKITSPAGLSVVFAAGLRAVHQPTTQVGRVVWPVGRLNDAREGREAALSFVRVHPRWAARGSSCRVESENSRPDGTPTLHAAFRRSAAYTAPVVIYRSDRAHHVHVQDLPRDTRTAPPGREVPLDQVKYPSTR